MVIKVNSIVILSILVFLICVDTSVSVRKLDKGEENVDLGLFQVYDRNNTIESNPYVTYDRDGRSAKAAKVVYFREHTDVVVVLGRSNFSEYISKNKYVMVLYYAPWCHWSKSFKWEYFMAATELKDRDDAVVAAKVDGTKESELLRKYHGYGYPNLHFFIDGVFHKAYYGKGKKDAIVAWVKSMMLNNLTTPEEAKKILASGKQVVLGYLDALVGSESNELSAASHMEDEIEFYQTTSSEVAKLFKIDQKVKRPALVYVEEDSKKFNYFGGEFAASSIAEFVSVNKYESPLVSERYYKNNAIPDKALRFVGGYLRQVWQVWQAFEEY